MIQFNNLSQETPYLVFKKKYNKALKTKQKNIEAICISSYSSEAMEVNARFVNLKFVNNNEFIFFSNYKSPKSQDFLSHNQITALTYWNNINVQVRMKAYITQTSKRFNQDYFSNRNMEKNALAISSHQSAAIESYEAVQKNYDLSLREQTLTECPYYWGGYSFTSYYFEFWEDNETRLNKRETYKLQNNEWIYGYLQP